jgi:transketolase
MRKEFAAWLEAYGAKEERVVVLTGDLGFQALEGVRARLGHRFVNAGVAEQNMVSMAAGLASEGLRPFCYSIAPFAVFRPAEQIRLDVCVHDLDVKIVGNGGGYGYGIMGSTHHALEDIAVLSSFQHMRCYLPVTGADVAVAGDAMMSVKGPGYFRLNLGQLPAGHELETPFAPVRKIRVASPTEAPRLTVIALGPIALNALGPASASGRAEVFAVSEVPLPLELPASLLSSIEATKNVLVIEEHVERGGLAEHLALKLLKAGLTPRLETRAAKGYPSHTYGSQKFHQQESSLDQPSVLALIDALTEKSRG